MSVKQVIMQFIKYKNIGKSTLKKSGTFRCFYKKKEHFTAP